MKALFILASVSLALSGCATPTAGDIADIKPSDYVEQIRSELANIFVDPASLKDTEISEPFPVNTVFDGITPIPRSGWAVCLKTNAKNRLGGYTGKHPVLFLFESGKLSMTLDQGGGWNQVSQHCDRGRYRPIKLS